MSPAYRFVIVALALALLLQPLVAWRPVAIRGLPPPSALECARFSASQESSLAHGCRIPLSSVRVDTLELLPGISEARALRLLEQSSQIRERAKRLPGAARCVAFEVGNGIGKALAKTLCAAVDPLR